MRKLLLTSILLFFLLDSFAHWDTEFISDSQGTIKTAHVTNNRDYILSISNLENTVIVSIRHKFKSFSSTSKVKLLFNGVNRIETIDALVHQGSIILMKSPLYMARDLVFINNLKNGTVVTFYINNTTIPFTLTGSKKTINWALN